MNGIIEGIRRALRENIDAHTKQTGQRFFKESIDLYGVKTAVVSKIAKEHFQNLENKDKTFVFRCCEELWRSGLLEESFIASKWSYAVRKEYQPEDFAVFAHWMEHYVSNWASCDTLGNHTIGAFIEMYPEYLSGLKEWARSNNRWMRRASAISLIIPAQQGKFLQDIFDIAGILLLDQDDLVQKGYGWLLKEASRKNQQEVFDFVLKHKKVMPRTALRYAIEKMPQELRKAAMAKP